MKKTLMLFITLTLLILAACGNGEEENNANDDTENSTSEDSSDEETSEGTSDGASEDKGTIVFGQTPWTSTAPPTQIAKQILEEQGFTVEVNHVSQPIIWGGMSNKEMDFFMDAWLRYTEAPRMGRV
ncbi:glycine betaine ABC transporter substrate-binding protein [Salibacterium aidingense]|uniref:glycine betaine ABC transporter substrate-binding protein n=1 Tax=Salibacterium aidingense TaxID=384933 RepID=UPI003BE39093